MRKALLAASVTPATYGRAFGFERMLDTVGAIVGPATAWVLLQVHNNHYSALFAWTLVPGLLAVGCIALLVREQARPKVAAVSFHEGLRELPGPFRRFLVAVSLFGAGDFAHTLLILLATQKLAPELGATRAASYAVSLYVLHNIFYAAFAFFSGWLADRMSKRILLAGGYALAAGMSILVIVTPLGLWTLAVVFVVGGIYVGIEETLEDSLCAELVGAGQHGMAFGVLATVNGVGDFLSSIAVGALWSAFGTSVAFGYCAVLSTIGALLVLKRERP